MCAGAQSLRLLIVTGFLGASPIFGSVAHLTVELLSLLLLASCAERAVEGRLPWPLGTLSARERAPGGSRLWFPSLRLGFQKGRLAAQTWWAQVGSNHRHLACKAEYGQEYAQLSALVYASDLRKPCPEMPWGAWESVHGGSRKWFPEQSADPSLLERVATGGARLVSAYLAGRR